MVVTRGARIQDLPPAMAPPIGKPPPTQGTSKATDSQCEPVASSHEDSKRKASVSPKAIAKMDDDGTMAGLKCMMSSLKSALYESGFQCQVTGDMRIHNLLKQIHDVLTGLINQQQAANTGRSNKKTKVIEVPATDLAARPTMVDAGTDMDLTPKWWESEATREAETAVKHVEKLAKKTASKSLVAVKAMGNGEARNTKAGNSACDTGADSAADTDGEGWRVQKKRKVKNRATPNTQTKPVQNSTKQKVSRKSPAVEVKVAAGMSFADTVRAVRVTSGVRVDELGAAVKTMRQTRSGNLIVEFGMGTKAEAAAVKLQSMLKSAISDKVGPIVNLGAVAEIEILDIDAVADRTEVEKALNRAVAELPGDMDRSGVKFTGMWSTRSGNQIATAQVPKSVAAAIIRLPIGWTMCRVRPRTQAPVRCFKCHGYSHVSAECKGPDLTKACRRCGEPGHREKECATEQCVACKRLGDVVVAPHKPGSARCEARRRAGPNWTTLQ